MKKPARYLIAGIICILLTTAITACSGIVPEVVQPSIQPAAPTASGSTAPVVSMTPAPAVSKIPTPAVSKTPAPDSNAEDYINSENVSLKSKSLKQKMRMNVYLPSDYDSAKEYAVLYLIHGYGGTEYTWGGMKLAAVAGALFKSGKVKPYIIVTPDIGNSFAINSSKKTTSNDGIDFGRYEDYVIKDVIGYIDKHYSTVKGREGRYIGGFSMGGYAALHLGMAYTDLFSKIGGHSPAAILKGDTRPDMWRFLYPTDEDKQDRNPMLLAESADLSDTAIYLDCGTEDRLSRGTELLYNTLKEKNVQVEYHAYPGDHNLEYWKSHVEEYLLFYGTD